MIDRDSSQDRNFVCLIDIGPTHEHMEQAREVLDSLVHYEPAVKQIIAVSESPLLRENQELASRYAPKLTVVDRPWTSRWSDGVWGRACSRTMLGLAKAYSDFRPFSFLVKLDTDSLVIGPFSAKVGSVLRENPGVGIAGTYKRYPNGDPRVAPVWSKIIRRYADGITFMDLKKNHVSLVYYAMHRRLFSEISATIGEAIKKGYEPAENCAGGGYLLSPLLVEKMNERGITADPKKWLYLTMAEDILVSLCARYLGFELQDFNREGEPVGVQHKGLAFSPPELVDRGYSIIHSTRTDDRYSQHEILEFFRRRRDSWQVS